MVGTSRSEIRQLASEDGGPCVSIHLPTHRAGNDNRQDPTRLHNLLGAAKARIIDHGGDAEALLAPMRELLSDDHFWRHQKDGLALFSCAGAFRRVQLPYSVDELCEVGERFAIKPLLPAVTGDGRLYVLALSQTKVRVIEASRHRAQEIAVDGLPSSLEDALGLEVHTSVPSSRRREAISQGASPDARKDVARFSRIVDERVLAAVDRASPMVVAAVDWVAGIYRDVSRHPALVADVVEGNPNALSANELAQRAFPLAAPRLREPERQAAKRLAVAIHRGHASLDADAIVEAAADGRVETLFVAVDRCAWGRFDSSNRRVEMHHVRAAGDEDLVNLAAVLTLRHDGAVYASMPEEISGSAAAALFRY
jgi:hypothetical protein